MENFYKKEVDKFNKILKSWWNINNLSIKPLHDINYLRMNLVKIFICSLYNKKILDIGCGGGIFSESISKMGANVTGIDLSERSIKEARFHCISSNLNIKYKIQSIECFSKDILNKFDLIFCMEVLEHVPEFFLILKSCSRIIKKQGYIFVSTINRNLKSFLYAIFFAERIFRIIPYGTHKYNKFITPLELIFKMNTCKMCFQSLIGIKYNFFENTYNFSKNISTNYIIISKKT